MSDEASPEAELPVVEPPFEREGSRFSGSPRVGGILLAAGTSSRFGEENKLLVTVDGEPIVRHAARTLTESSLEWVVVVVGHEADRVRSAVSDLPVFTVHNPEYASGQASSVRTGISALRGWVDADAAVIALGDMPFVDSGTVDALVSAYESGAGTALAAAYRGTRGNPVLFDSRHFDALTEVGGDIGGRDILLGGDESALVAVDDTGVRRDIDEPKDIDGGR